MTTAITPFLWFDNNLEEAMDFYKSVFDDVEISNLNRHGEGGPLFSATFRINNQPFMGMNAGPMFHFNEAVSFFIACKDQKEVDYYWEKLTDGGEESMCGWLKDKFGLSWQVIPDALGQLLGSPHAEGARRAMQAMMQMRKIDVATLQAAHDGML